MVARSGTTACSSEVNGDESLKTLIGKKEA
jgi:hypothetical protein